MSCSSSPGSTHHAACPCRESAHAEEVARLAAALRHAARELQYIADAGPCEVAGQHVSGETFACIALAERLLGPMRDWPDEPNASALAADAPAGEEKSK